MPEEVVDYNTQVILTKRPTKDYPDKEDVFQVKYVPPIPTDQIKEGQVVVKNLFMSIDATNRVWISGMKSYMKPINPGDIMKGQAVGEVLFSKDKRIKVGQQVLGLSYWQKYSVLAAKELMVLPKGYPKVEDYLGVLGIAGLTAYFGIKKIGMPKEGEIFVVSAAAGSVGEIAIQLAKIFGCKVCGIVGSEKKAQYISSIGADYTINYKKQSVKSKLKEFFPKGIDIYFDNVGGEMLDDVLMNIKFNSRVIMCGTISSYNSLDKPYRLKNYARLIIKSGLMKGFLYFDYVKQFPEVIMELMGYIKEGKIKYRVDYSYGVEECPKALKKLLKGENDGKVIVKIDKGNEKAKL